MRLIKPDKLLLPLFLTLLFQATVAHADLWGIIGEAYTIPGSSVDYKTALNLFPNGDFSLKNCSGCVCTSEFATITEVYHRVCDQQYELQTSNRFFFNRNFVIDIAHFSGAKDIIISVSYDIDFSKESLNLLKEESSIFEPGSRYKESYDVTGRCYFDSELKKWEDYYSYALESNLQQINSKQLRKTYSFIVDDSRCKAIVLGESWLPMTKDMKYREVEIRISGKGTKI